MTRLIILLLLLFLVVIFGRPSLFHVNLQREREKQRIKFRIVLVSYFITATVKSNLTATLAQVASRLMIGRSGVWILCLWARHFTQSLCVNVWWWSQGPLAQMWAASLLSVYPRGNCGYKCSLPPSAWSEWTTLPFMCEALWVWLVSYKKRYTNKIPLFPIKI